MPDLPSLSVQHKNVVYIGSNFFSAVHTVRAQLKRSPAVICNNSSVCGACNVGTGKVIEFYDEDTYEFQLVDNTVNYYGHDTAVNIYYWDKFPNRSSTTPILMQGFNFYKSINLGDKFTFTPKGNARWLSFMRRSLYKYNSVYVRYDFDSLCVRLNNTTKVITAISF